MPAPAAPRPGGYRIGSLAGSEVYVQGSSLVYAAIIAYLLSPVVDAAVPGLGGLTYVAGLALAVLFYLTLLLHEASHAIVATRYGHRVPSITIHFFGAMTHVEGESSTAREEFTIAVVGPLTSLLVGLVGLAALQLHLGGLPGVAIAGLTVANLAVGVLNLVPGLPLDGGRVLAAAVWWIGGDRHRGTLAAGWSGRAVATAVVAIPVVAYLVGHPVDTLDAVIYVAVAAFLWAGATSALRASALRSRLPQLQARTLARRTLGVPEDLPLAEAVRRAAEAEADAIMTVAGDGRPLGLVSESALRATPDERRPWMTTSVVSRSLEPGTTLSADLRGEDLVRALGGAPAEAYLLVEADGSVLGVLRTDDVDRAYREAAQSPVRRDR